MEIFPKKIREKLLMKIKKKSVNGIIFYLNNIKFYLNNIKYYLNNIKFVNNYKIFLAGKQKMNTNKPLSPLPANAHMAQSITRPSSEQIVAGSNPGDFKFIYFSEKI